MVSCLDRGISANPDVVGTFIATRPRSIMLDGDVRHNFHRSWARASCSRHATRRSKSGLTHVTRHVSSISDENSRWHLAPRPASNLTLGSFEYRARVDANRIEKEK